MLGGVANIHMKIVANVMKDARRTTQAAARIMKMFAVGYAELEVCRGVFGDVWVRVCRGDVGVWGCWCVCVCVCVKQGMFGCF